MTKSRRGRYAEALIDATEAVRLDPGYPWAYVGRARALAGLGRFDDALADLDRAIELQPTDIEVYIERASLHFQVGRLEDAIDDSTRVIQLAPDDPRGYGNRAVELLQAKQYERAIADLTQFLVLEPDNAAVYRSLGLAYVRTKQYAEAIASYTEAMKLEPGFWGDVYNRANIHLHLGQFEEAITDLSRVIDLQDEPGLAFLRRGMAYEVVGATQLALADYDRAAQQSGSTAEYARMWQHILLRQMGEERAAAEILASLRSSSNGAVWIDRLFDLLTGTLSPEELLAAAVTKDESAEAYYYIGRLALLDDRPDDAKAAFQNGISLNRNGILETDFARAVLKQLNDQSTSD